MIAQLKIAVNASAETVSEEEAIALDMIHIYLIKFYQRRYVIPRPIQRSFHIRNVEEFCGDDYRFRTREDLQDVFDYLQIPASCGPFDNGAYEDGEKLFLYFIRRLSTAGRVKELIKEFGKDKTHWSRAFNWMLNFVSNRWRHLLTGFRPGFVARLGLYAQKIEEYVQSENAPIPNGSNSIALFIDCIRFETNMPAGGPVTYGPGADRWPPIIQEAFFNGWGKKHGLKEQTTDAPDGLTVNHYGATSLRHSDLNLLAWSNLNQELINAQPNMALNTRKAAFGDSIYPMQECVKCKTGITVIDEAHSSARVSIEHHYQELGTLFPLCKFKRKLKIWSNQQIADLIFCSFLLRNMYTCIYRNKTSLRMNCQPPTLAQYMAF